MERTSDTRKRILRVFRSLALLFALLIGGLVVGRGYDTEFGCGCKPVTFTPPDFRFN